MSDVGDVIFLFFPEPMTLIVYFNVYLLPLLSLFLSLSLSSLSLSSLILSSLFPPSLAVLYQAVLTHEEIAQLLLYDANNNMMSVVMGGRQFWAIPDASTYAVVNPNAQISSASSAGGMSSGAQLGLIVAIAVGAVLVIIAIFLVIRRRRLGKHATVS